MKRLRRNASRGFSLIEVAIALGFLSCALLMVAGLFPVGLSTLKAAMDETTESQIVQRISMNASLSNFHDLSSHFQGGVFYFDQEGEEFISSKHPTEKIYRVETRYTAPLLTPFSSADLSESLARIEIKISRNYSTAKTAGKTYFIYVATNGR